MTFTEIADAVSSEEKQAYSAKEIIHRLLRSMSMGEFETWGGFSRLFITAPGNPPKRMVFHRNPSLKIPIANDIKENQARSIKTSILEAYLQAGIKDFDDGLLDHYLSYLTLERSDFVRWYRRFKDGKYDRD